MLILDEQKFNINNLKLKFDGILSFFKLDKMQERLKELKTLQEDMNLYSDLKKAQEVNSEAKRLESKILFLNKISSRLADLIDFVDMVEEEGNESMEGEINSDYNALEKEIEKLHLESLLRGEYDDKNAIMTLHAGAGGTEAQDWVEMLYRMYRMYADKNDFSINELDYLAGDEAGIKTVTFTLCGENAYGYLKAEKGVHRLVRISPFDANARRHTSFASLEVMPEIENDPNIKIKADELRVDTYRSGGAGGQHVNKTDSAVRITHIPSGIVVQCQNERSQIQNRETAMKMLMSKLVEKKEREQQEKANNIMGQLKRIEWGSQIRSYVFQPYTLVKDHRTGFECSDINAMMNGDRLNDFIFDYLRKSNE